MPLVQRIALPVIDSRTTRVCLHVAGQIVGVDETFETLAGDFVDPPFHIHCRTMVAPWMPGMINQVRIDSNKELMRRPKSFRRLGPDGEIGARIPPPSTGNDPESYTFPGSAEAAWKPKNDPEPPTKKERAQLRPGESFDEDGHSPPQPGMFVRWLKAWILPDLLEQIRAAVMQFSDDPELQQDLLDWILEYTARKLIRTIADLPAKVIKLLRLE